MRLTDFIEDPAKRWDVDKLNLDVLNTKDLKRIIELTEIGIQYDKDPDANRPMTSNEKVELDNICRKAANNGRRLML